MFNIKHGNVNYLMEELIINSPLPRMAIRMWNQIKMVTTSVVEFFYEMLSSPVIVAKMKGKI